jgi:hypothetical protein
MLPAELPSQFAWRMGCVAGFSLGCVWLHRSGCGFVSTRARVLLQYSGRVDLQPERAQHAVGMAWPICRVYGRVPQLSLHH